MKVLVKIKLIVEMVELVGKYFVAEDIEVVVEEKLVGENSVDNILVVVLVKVAVVEKVDVESSVDVNVVKVFEEVEIVAVEKLDAEVIGKNFVEVKIVVENIEAVEGIGDME